jgi:RNA polymerase sigma-70 factor, ECF subfamily
LRQEGGNRDRESMASVAAQVPLAAEHPRPEAELLARLRRGDRDAASEFYDRYAARVHRFILHTLGAAVVPQDADDLMQETFISVAEALPFFRGESSLFTFACAIAHRKTMSFVRTNARRARIVSTMDASDPREMPPARDEGLRRALSALNPEYRELLHLKYVEDATTAEIARIVGASEHAVESKLKRARDALRKRLEGER